jgi:hypothetical protein
MRRNSFDPTPDKREGRAKVSNGSCWLPGVDGRSAGARRFRDLTKAFAAELGGLATLSEPERALVRQAAGLTLQTERLQVAIAKGDKVDPDELIRLSSEARRALNGIRRRERPKPPSLSDYLAGKRGDAA